MNTESLSSAYFDGIYAANPDPWDFESSAYEREKYAVTLAALRRPRYGNAFEVGCSIGVLTAQLALRCDRLLAVDLNESALRRSRERCVGLNQVEFARMRVPQETPEGTFDLVAISEVGYFWSPKDLARASDWMLGALRPEGSLLLVHWTPKVPDFPLTGDDVHGHFLQLAEDGKLRHVHGTRYAQYRLDLFTAPSR